ncbi:MAG: hypothetical protein WCM76_05200 [Bacteroidota bacterium]
MKNNISVFIFILVLLITSQIHGQDYVVDKNSDTVRCSITSIADSTLFLSILFHEEKRETFVHLSQIRAYYYLDTLHVLNNNFPENNTTRTEKVYDSVTPDMINKGNFFITVDGGCDVTREMYFFPLSNPHAAGLSIKVHGGFFVSNVFGLGLKANCYWNKAEAQYSNIIRGSSTSEYNDNIRLIYIAPTLTIQSRAEPGRPVLSLQLSFGPVFFHNKSHEREYGSQWGFWGYPGTYWDYQRDTTWTVRTYGAEINGGIEVPVTRNLLVDIQLAYFYSPPVIRQYEQTINISRIGIAAGLRYSIKTHK